MPIPAPEPEHSLLDYEVSEAAVDAMVLIRMSEEKGSRVYELVFDRVCPTLRRVVRICVTLHDTVIDILRRMHTPGGPHATPKFSTEPSVSYARPKR